MTTFALRIADISSKFYVTGFGRAEIKETGPDSVGVVNASGMAMIGRGARRDHTFEGRGNPVAIGLAIGLDSIVESEERWVRLFDTKAEALHAMNT